MKREGERFLTDFPHANERMEMALEVADADARANDTKDEFAILHDSLLTELGQRSCRGCRLTAGVAMRRSRFKIRATLRRRANRLQTHLRRMKQSMRRRLEYKHANTSG